MAKAATATAPKPTTPSLKIVEVKQGDLKKATTGIEGLTKFGQTLMIPPAAIRVIPAFNVRVDNESYREAQAELKASIKSEGFFQTKPLSGYAGKDGDDDVIFVTDGHRRLAAVNELIAEGVEITTIPVVLKDSKISMVDLTVALVKENTGKRLTMLENAIIVKRLLNNGLDKKKVIERLGFTDRGVDDFILLINAPKSIRRAVMDEKITGTEAVRQLRKHSKDPKKAESAVSDMIEAALKKGKAKATRADSGDDSKAATRAEKAAEKDVIKSKVKMAAVTHEFIIDADTDFELKDIAAFSGLLGGDDWYKLDEEREGWARTVEPVSFIAKVKRVKKEEPAAEAAADEAGEEGLTDDETTEEAETAAETTEEGADL